MQNCNSTSIRQLRNGTVCASASNNSVCTTPPKLSSLKIDPESLLSPLSAGKTCATSDSKEITRPSTRVSSGRRRLAFLAIAAALNGCVPDWALLSETDATAEVSQVDAIEDDSQVTDVKKPPRDASVDEEETDASLDATEEDIADAAEEDISDVIDVAEEDLLDATDGDVAEDRVTPRDVSDVMDAADVADATEEDIPTDRVPPRDIADAAEEDILDATDGDVTEDRSPPRDVSDVADAADVVDAVDASVDRPDVMDIIDVPSDVGLDVRDVVDVVDSAPDVPADVPRFCTSLTAATVQLTNVAIGSCIPNMDGSSNSTCPTSERLTNSGLALFFTATDGSRTQFTIRIFCIEGGNATMELGPSAGITITLRARTDHFGWCISNGISSFDFDFTDAFYRSVPEGFAGRGSLVYRVNSTSHVGAPCGATFTTMVRTP